jgi:hypothetical protein
MADIESQVENELDEKEQVVEETVVEDGTDSGEETDDAELAVTTDVKPEKYRWVIPNFSQIQKDTYETNEKYFSEIFEIGGCKWYVFSERATFAFYSILFLFFFSILIFFFHRNQIRPFFSFFFLTAFFFRSLFL